jgi:hypothetical protein
LPRYIQQVALRKLRMLNNVKTLNDLGIPPAFWLGLQAQYDFDVTAEALGERLDHEVRAYAVNK